MATVAETMVVEATVVEGMVEEVRAALEGKVDIARRNSCRQRICPSRLARNPRRLDRSRH